MNKSKEKDRNSVKWLLMVVVIISFPLFAGVRAAAVGVNIAEAYPFYEHLEILSGALLAVMEGWALYTVSGYWQRFKTNQIYWWVIALINLVISLILPFTSTAYLVSAQFELKVHQVLTWGHILTNHLTWGWSFAVAAVTTLLVIGLGIVHGIQLPEPVPVVVEPEPVAPERNVEAYKNQVFGYLSRNMKEWPQPSEVVKAVEGITEDEALTWMAEWYNDLSKPGVKGEKEKVFVAALNGRVK